MGAVMRRDRGAVWVRGARKGRVWVGRSGCGGRAAWTGGGDMKAMVREE